MDGIFTHLDRDGRAKMVDVSEKLAVRRRARARGKILLSSATLGKIRDLGLEKGDVLTVAKLAGIAGAKKTSELIPLCHPLPLEQVDLALRVVSDGVEIESLACTTGKTGVEMEALTAVAVACLTVYDMCKAVDQGMRITDIVLVEKTKEKEFAIVSLNRSDRKGERKTPVPRATLVAGQGIEGDAHAGDGLRQVSLLAVEDIEEMIRRGARVGPGDFAENITTRGVPLAELPLGTLLTLGEAELEVTQIGKECHDRCAIFRQIGDCVMPRRGIFARVRRGGEISCENRGYYRL